MHVRRARRTRPRTSLAVAAVLAVLSTGTVAATDPPPDEATAPPAIAERQDDPSPTPTPEPDAQQDAAPAAREAPVPDSAPDPVLAADDPTRADADVAAQIARECTQTSAQILTALLNLGGRQQFTTVRHRGDFDARTPENSLNAFQQSYVRCRAGVETDVRRTADGTLVMFHDTHIGKMLEPTYNPEQNTGPNPALASLTWAQLQQRDLVNIARQPQAGVKVPSFEQFLDHYRRVGGRSLLYGEVKNSSNDQAQSRREVLEVVEHLAAFHRQLPEAEIFDRVVVKFRMSVFPRFQEWSSAAHAIDGVPKVPLSQVMMSRQIARSMNTTAAGVDQAVTSWASTGPEQRVLSVEVTMKDSTAYSHLVLRRGSNNTEPFRNIDYYTAAGNATAPSGTMANAVEIVRRHEKPLGQFVPIPDWVMFRDPRTFDWNRTLPNADAGKSTVPVTAREAYFNNDSRCCYALRDRIDGTAQDRDPEQNDQRMLLPWLEDIGATFLTADDTDSIDRYFRVRGRLLDTGTNRERPNQPDLEMNSLIHPESRHIPSLLKYVQVTVRPVSESSRWYASGTVRVTEAHRPGPAATVRDRLTAFDSRFTPDREGVAVYGQAAIHINAHWRWTGPSDNFDHAFLAIDLPEHLGDGRHTQEMRLRDGTRLIVQYTISRQWATAREFSLNLQSNATWQVHGNFCGFSSGPPPAGDRCNTGDLSESRGIVGVARNNAVSVAPGGTMPLSLQGTTVSGARPLFVRTDLTGRRVLPDMSLSHGTLTLDGWGTNFGTRQSVLIGGTSPHAFRVGYLLDAGSSREVP